MQYQVLVRSTTGYADSITPIHPAIQVLKFQPLQKLLHVICSHCLYGIKWQAKQYNNMTIITAEMHTKVPHSLESYDPLAIKQLTIKRQ
jgi:hypothetical protein